MPNLRPLHPCRVLWALALAAGVLLADQFSKWWILLVMQPPHTIPVMPFVSFDLVWNRGVTFGMLQNEKEHMPYILAAAAAVIIVLLLRWLWRAENRLVACSIGLIIGGAIGNIIDRFRFGAVVDFIHVQHYPWIFNIADSAVVVGVILLILDSFRKTREPAA